MEQKKKALGRGLEQLFSSEVLDLAIDYDLCKKSGGWYTTHTGERVQGKPNLTAYYDSHPDEAAELREMVVAKLKGTDTSLIQEDYEVDEDGVIIE